MTRGIFRDHRLEEMLMVEGMLPRESEQALAELERYTGQDRAALSAEYWRNRGSEDRQAQDRVSVATDEAPVIEYYRETAQYLYELSYAEGSVKRQGWLRVLAHACRRYGARRVLDVGGGVGSVSLYLQQQGLQCDHLDVPGPHYRYAQWRFMQRSLPIGFYDATQEWPAGPYDAIIAWDVLEHLKNLPEKVGWIAQRLRPGGLLMHLSTFTECEGVHLPENHCYGEIRAYDALLGRCGLAYVGQLKPDRFSRLLRRLGWSVATLGVRVKPRLKFGGCFLLHRRRNACAS